MKNCWKVEPTDRPTFKEIRESLQSMLMDTEVKLHFVSVFRARYHTSVTGLPTFFIK